MEESILESVKRCSYCGHEYPDSAERCSIDGQALEGGEAAQLCEQVTLTVPTAPSVALGSDDSAASLIPTLNNRRLRWIEILLVCAIAFGGSILTSAFYFFHWRSSAVGGGILRWINSVFHEIAALGLLRYVLYRRSRTFVDLGLSWTWRDGARSIALMLVSYAAFVFVYCVLYYGCWVMTGRKMATVDVGARLFSGGISWATIVFQFVNPFFEEMIVRAYVITEALALTGSLAMAVGLSTVLQMSYHFYQGAPMALAEGASFLVMSLYFAKARRIAPCILAHLYFDMGATLYILYHQN